MLYLINIGVGKTDIYDVLLFSIVVLIVITIGVIIFGITGRVLGGQFIKISMHACKPPNIK